MSTALQNIKDQMNAELAELGSTVAPPASRKISTAGKKFTLPDGTAHPGPLTCVVLDHTNFNAYYKKAYDPQNPVGPDCFALSKVISDMAPHEQAPEAQNEDCATCPMNKFQSAAQGKGKACRNKVRLAIAPSDCDPEDDPMTLEASPSSIKTWNSFVSKLKQQGILPVQAVTEISFDEHSPYPVLVFKVKEMHDELEKFWGLKERAQEMLMQPPITNDD